MNIKTKCEYCGKERFTTSTAMTDSYCLSCYNDLLSDVKQAINKLEDIEDEEDE